MGIDRRDQRKRTICQLHHDSLERRQGAGNLDQAQLDRLVWTQHRAGSDTKQERITNLTCSTCHSDFHGRFHNHINLRTYLFARSAMGTSCERLADINLPWATDPAALALTDLAIICDPARHTSDGKDDREHFQRNPNARIMMPL